MRASLRVHCLDVFGCTTTHSTIHHMEVRSERLRHPFRAQPRHAHAELKSFLIAVCIVFVARSSLSARMNTPSPTSMQRWTISRVTRQGLLSARQPARVGGLVSVLLCHQIGYSAPPRTQDDSKKTKRNSGLVCLLVLARVQYSVLPEQQASHLHLVSAKLAGLSDGQGIRDPRCCCASITPARLPACERGSDDTRCCARSLETRPATRQRQRHGAIDRASK